MTDATSGEILSDRPVCTEEEDRFARYPFARRLARTAATAPASEGLVIGLAASWGDGKSSVLCMARHVLEGDAEFKDRVRVLEFNPWLWSGTGHLVEQFFAKLAQGIPEEPTTPPPTTPRWPAGLRKNLESFGKMFSLLSAVPTPLTPVLAATSKLLQFGSVVVQREEKVTPPVEPPDLEKRRDAIIAGMRDAPQRLIVLIDDLDRLRDEEIRDVAQLVKLVADFPNVVYVLAYDRERVETALKQTGAAHGYVEKIVQVPLDLPRPHPDALRGALDEAITPAIAPLPQVLWEESRWAELYEGGLRPLLRTARDAKRFANGLFVAATEIGEEVNGVDLAGVTALRVFAPPLYRRMADQPDMLLGTRTLGGDTEERLKERRDRIEGAIKLLDDRLQEPTREILRVLLPQVRALLNGGTAAPDRTWLLKLRLCHPSIYLRYFALSLPKGHISKAHLQELFDLAQRDYFGFEQKLRERMPDVPSSYFVDRYLPWASELGSVAGFIAVRSVVRIWEFFSDQPSPERMDGDQRQIGFLVYGFLSKTDDRRTRLDQAIRLVQDATIPGAIWVSRICDLRLDGKEPLLNAKEQDELRKYIFERTFKLDDEQLLENRPVEVLEALSDWGRETDARAWAERLVSRKDTFIKLLSAARTLERYYTGNRVVETVKIRRKALGRLIDLDKAGERAQRLLQNGGLEKEEMDLLVLFLLGLPPSADRPPWDITEE